MKMTVKEIAKAFLEKRTVDKVAGRGTFVVKGHMKYTPLNRVFFGDGYFIVSRLDSGILKFHSGLDEIARASENRINAIMDFLQLPYISVSSYSGTFKIKGTRESYTDDMYLNPLSGKRGTSEREVLI